MNDKKEYLKDYYEKNKESLTEYKKQYYLKNKERLNLKDKENHIKNKDRYNELSREYYKNNKQVQRSRQKRYYEDNKEEIIKKQQIYNNNRKKIDPLFKLTCMIRTNIYCSLKRNNHIKSSPTQIILGCSFQELKSYLESKFQSWMTWENQGQYNGDFNFGWDVDHIIPLSSAKNEEEILKLNHYTNLQPLCSKFNREIKGDKIIN